VNYLYDLEQVTKNHEDFVSEGKVIASKEIEKLAKTFKLEIRAVGETSNE